MWGLLLLHSGAKLKAAENRREVKLFWFYMSITSGLHKVGLDLPLINISASICFGYNLHRPGLAFLSDGYTGYSYVTCCLAASAAFEVL